MLWSVVLLVVGVLLVAAGAAAAWGVGYGLIVAGVPVVGFALLREAKS